MNYFQISGSRLPRFDQVTGTPGKCRTTKLHDQHIRHEARMSAIAVRKRMNEYKAVMKPNCLLVWKICVVLDPIASIAKQRDESLADFVGGNAEIFLSSSILPRPLPRLIEHFQMQLANVLV